MWNHCMNSKRRKICRWEGVALVRTINYTVFSVECVLSNWALYTVVLYTAVARGWGWRFR
jgi:hypothetical protein